MCGKAPGTPAPEPSPINREAFQKAHLLGKHTDCVCGGWASTAPSSIPGHPKSIAQSFPDMQFVLRKGPGLTDLCQHYKAWKQGRVHIQPPLSSRQRDAIWTHVPSPGQLSSTCCCFPSIPFYSIPFHSLPFQLLPLPWARSTGSGHLEIML